MHKDIGAINSAPWEFNIPSYPVLKFKETYSKMKLESNKYSDSFQLIE